MIRVLSATFRNFRTLRDVTVPLRQQTVLVGPNNVGKTSVLEGLEFALGLGRRSYSFDELDVSTGVDPSVGFEIALTLVPTEGDRFTATEVELFGTHVDVVDSEHRLFILVAGRREDDDGVFRTRLRYLKSDGDQDGPVAAIEREALGVLLLPAVREARHEFGERGGLWSRLGAEADVSPEALAKLAELGAEVGETVVTEILGPAVAAAVSTNVSGLIRTVLYADQGNSVLDYSATSIDPAQALRQVDLRLTTPDQTLGSRIGDHSVGTQSVAMFGLFGAYADVMRERVVAVGIEEPEAHLHPHAVRAIVRRLLDDNVQTLITTHSTSVTDAADPRSIVRLRRIGDTTEAHAVGGAELSDRDVRTIRRLMADVGSDFLFARAVLLAEGLSERLALPVLAARLGLDFDTLGVTVVRVEGDRFGAFAKLLGADGLDIPFARLGDRDAARRLVRDAKREGVLPAAADEARPEDSRDDAASRGWFWWSQGDLEEVLISAGGGALFAEALVDLYGDKVFERYANGAKVAMPEPVGDDPAFLHAVASSRLASKPLVAQRVAELMVERGVSLPAELEEVLRFVAELAISEARASVAAPVAPPPAA
jgi:putative ATP-dependent endonuclease of OLD family